MHAVDVEFGILPEYKILKLCQEKGLEFLPLTTPPSIERKLREIQRSGLGLSERERVEKIKEFHFWNSGIRETAFKRQLKKKGNVDCVCVGSPHADGMIRVLKELGSKPKMLYCTKRWTKEELREVAAARAKYLRRKRESAAKRKPAHKSRRVAK